MSPLSYSRHQSLETDQPLMSPAFKVRGMITEEISHSIFVPMLSADMRNLVGTLEVYRKSDSGTYDMIGGFTSEEQARIKTVSQVITVGFEAIIQRIEMA